MKKAIFILTMLAFLCSCDNIEDPGGGDSNGSVVDLRLYIAIVDESLNDRLNPESPAYLGEAYSDGVKLFYLHQGEKITPLQAYYLIGGGDWFHIDNVTEYYKTNVKPGVITSYNADSGEVSHFYENSFGFYFVDCELYTRIADNSITYSYIQYADGSEDEIKTHIYVGPNRTIIDKIWINGELAYELISNDFDYYNAKYYPWSSPFLLNENGNICYNDGERNIGYNKDILVITK